MSKRDRQTVINNIKELNLEIDYEKLAYAIREVDKKRSEEEANDPAALRFTNLSAGILKGAAWSCFVIGVFLIIAFVQTFPQLSWGNIWHSIGTGIAIAVFVVCVVLAFMLFAQVLRFAKDVEAVKDKNYTISIFSALVSFVALIVALITLIKDVT